MPSARLTLVQRSPWAGRWITSVAIHTRFGYQQQQPTASLEPFYAAMERLPSVFPRLRELILSHDDSDDGPLPLPSLLCAKRLAPVFARLAQLEELMVSFFPSSPLATWSAEHLNALLCALSPLLRLRSFTLHLNRLSSPRLVDFAPLQCLPCLKTLEVWCDNLFHPSDDDVDDDTTKQRGCTVMQLHSIAACKQLTHLTCGGLGQWHPRWLEELARGRSLAAARISAASSATPAATAADAAAAARGTIVPFEQLAMRHRWYFPADHWAQLVKFNGLTHLSVDPTLAQWREIPRVFPMLRCLSVKVNDPNAIELWLSCFKQLPHLTELELFGGEQRLAPHFSPTLLQRLLDSAPLLHTLSLHVVAVPPADAFLAPLATAAPALTALSLRCRVANHTSESLTTGQHRVDWRPLLPCMHALRELRLVLPRNYDAVENSRRRAALLARMPLLSAVRYWEEIE